MAWPFSGNSGGNKSADQTLSEERLKILANVAIEQVPFPEQGMLSEEDAWTISPGPTRARINSQQSVPNVAASLAPAAPPVPAAPATVDTSGLERLISSRLDMVEDVLRMVEHRLEEGGGYVEVEGGAHGERALVPARVPGMGVGWGYPAKPKYGGRGQLVSGEA